VCNITEKEVINMTTQTYQTNKAGFVVFDGRIMSIHNFYVELCGSLMEGPNSLYCHTVGWANLHGYGEKWGSLDDREIDDLLLSTGARWVSYPSRSG
tara:strand:+ start:682 stop:972 length:291 start_codon:yes stop_codon:yes gene_type:complete